MFIALPRLSSFIPSKGRHSMTIPLPHEPHGTEFPSAFDPRLFTPGPLTTSLSVKQAMCHDIGAWDAPLKELVLEIRTELLSMGGVSQSDGWECTLMQGSGSFAIESALVSLTPRQGRLAVISNGAYGERMIKTAEMAGIDVTPICLPENQAATGECVASVLAADPSIHTVGVIHCETTTGILNDIASVSAAVKAAERRLIVDAMSTYAAYPIDLKTAAIDVLISSANKCIEGVPGFGFVLARRKLLEQAGAERWPRSHSLDLYDQWIGFERTGKFRFTPPNQVLLAFRQALREFSAEGGVAMRQARYQANHHTLLAGMDRLGFVPFLPRPLMSHIITTFLCPNHPAYDFQTFYDKLAARGMIIYPGKVTSASCSRIGNVGRLFPRDIEALLLAIEHVKNEMGFH